MNIAIIIGVSEYKFSTYENLPACQNDATLMQKIVEKAKALDGILYINENISAYEAKNKISTFIEEYKGTEINELFFYFSGHGERINEDFYYVFNDFELDKKESTGLRNSMLDTWIRQLNPLLTVKVVDACYSGTRYIKGESNVEATLKKSAQQNELKDSYFLFSSRDNESSIAGREFSYFTESFFTAFLEREGDWRYRDIIAYIADDMERRGAPAPIFIQQSSAMERFGVINKDIQEEILKSFGLDGGEHSEIIFHPEKTISDKKSKIMEVAGEIVFTYSELMSFFEDVKERIERWIFQEGEYHVTLDTLQDTLFVPNLKGIALWLDKNKDKGFFCTLSTETETYEANEYIELPVKPNPFGGILGGLLAQDRYRLEKVNKTRSKITGFSYNDDCSVGMIKIFLEPKISMLKPIVVYIIPVYSNFRLFIHYSMEYLHKTSWDSYSYPQCQNWKVIDVKIKSLQSSEKLEHLFKEEVDKMVENDIGRFLEN